MKPIKTRAPCHPPRPPNAFFVYKRNLRETFKMQGQDIPNQKIFNKLAGKNWRELPSAGKTPFFDMAGQEKRAHRMKYPDYTFRPVRNRRKSKKKMPGEERRGYQGTHYLHGPINQLRLCSPSLPALSSRSPQPTTFGSPGMLHYPVGDHGASHSSQL